MIHYGKVNTRVGSWSHYARKFADRLIESATYEIEAGRQTPEEARIFVTETLQNTRRNPLIVKRAAKRLHRKGWL